MTDLLTQLDHVARLAAASKWQRLLHAPGKYLYAIGFRQLVYARTRRGLVKEVSTFFGLPMRVVLPAGTDIYLTGGKSHDSEIRLARYLIHTLRPGQHFLDVGGHFGYFSLLASRLVGPTGRVRTYEASASTFAVLAYNVRQQANIEVCHQAVSDQPGQLAFYEFPVLFNEFNSLDVEQFAQEPWFRQYPPVRTEVAAVALAEVLAATGLQPAVIKIDVEGAEDKVIAGAAAALARQQPAVVMEYLAPHRHNATHRAAAAQLLALGYHPHALDAQGRPVPCPDPDAFLAHHAVDSDNFVFLKLPRAEV